MILGKRVEAERPDVIQANPYGHFNWNGDAHAALGFVLVEFAIVDSAVDKFELDVLALLLPEDQELIVEDVRP